MTFDTIFFTESASHPLLPSLYPIGILGHELLPAAATLVHRGASHLEVMAIGGTEGVGSVEEVRHLLLVNMKHATQHVGHLLLTCRTVARDGHLDLCGGIFGDGHLPTHGCSHGHTLCTAQLKHRLYVLAEEGGLDGELVGQIGVDDASHTFEDTTELKV